MTYYDIQYNETKEIFEIGYYAHRQGKEKLFVPMAESNTLTGASAEKKRLEKASAQRSTEAIRHLSTLDRRRYRGQA